MTVLQTGVGIKSRSRTERTATDVASPVVLRGRLGDATRII